MQIDAVLTLLVASRWVHFATLTVVFGGASFWVLSAPDEIGLAAARPLGATILLLRVAAPVAAVSGLAWLAGTIAYATGGLASLGDQAMLRVFFTETPFGVPALVRLALLFALMPIAALPMRPRVRIAACVVVGAALLVSQAWLGHADEGGDSPYGMAMIVTYAVHVLATAVWVGGLPSLFFLLVEARRAHAGRSLRRMLERYSTVATIAVVLILGSGALNTIYHDGGSLADLRSTTYGSVLAVKVALVAIMLGVAALNRFILMPKLDDGATSEAAIGTLQRSVALDTMVALLVLGAAAVLGITPPPQ